ncbi:MAG: hypothetical protein R3335_06040 [Anaerolineales bacterium]|nr:hypothetical protein [Anaerolineales bacterium]
MRSRAIYIIFGLLVFALVAVFVIVPARAATIPTISIEEVDPDVSVKIRTHDYPANREFVATMGPFGTRGVDGIVVGEINSGGGGSFPLTFDIPEELQGLDRIAIRLESPSGYYSYNWFYNNTSGGGTTPTATGTPAPTATPTATSTPGSGTPTATPAPTLTIPVISIEAVTRDVDVTILTHNYPANQTFTARMGPFGTQAKNGIVVGEVDSDGGGSFDATFEIPDELKGMSRIAIRLDSPQGYYSFNWFYNNTTN